MCDANAQGIAEFPQTDNPIPICVTHSVLVNSSRAMSEIRGSNSRMNAWFVKLKGVNRPVLDSAAGARNIVQEFPAVY